MGLTKVDAGIAMVVKKTRAALHQIVKVPISHTVDPVGMLNVRAVLPS